MAKRKVTECAPEKCEACGADWVYLAPSGRTIRATVFVKGEHAGMGKFEVDGGPEGRRVRVCVSCRFQWTKYGRFRRLHRNLNALAQIEMKKLRAMLDAGLSREQIGRALNVEPWAVAVMLNHAKLARKTAD